MIIHFISYLFVTKICWHITCNICWRITHNNCWHICWNSICCVYNFITHNHWIFNSTCWIIATSQLHITGWFQIFFFLIFTLTSTFIIIPILIWGTFLLSNLHLNSHDTWFINDFHSFIIFITLKILKI